MCGIAGWISARPVSGAKAGQLLEDLLSRIMTRGPDGRGVALSEDGRIGLAHTRLAIIDPEARSDQPMRDAASGAVIAYNGEIYNYRQLRAELAAAGATFATEGDTEVILQGYLREGVDFFRRLRGMYAFVISDPRSAWLVVLRDPLGIKPLYMAFEPDQVVFGSSPAAAAACAGLRPNPAAAVSLAVFGAVLDPLSPYQGVVQLPPGVLHILARDGPRIAVSRAPVEPAFKWAGGDRSGGLERLGECLSESVQAHLTSDVPVAVFQSAGLDSTVISALAKRAEHAPTLVTLGFDAFRDSPMDEVPGASLVAEQLGLPHRSLYVDRTQFETLGRRFLDEMRTPTADAFNSYLVAWLCRELGFKVALSGIGADELFAGYPSFRQLPRLRAAAAFARAPGAERLLRAAFELAWRADSRRSPKLRFTGAYLPDFRRRYLLRRAYFLPEELPAILRPEIVEAGLPQFLSAFETLAARAAPETEAGVRALELDLYMRNVLLRDADWAGMAHGVEIRTPYVDLSVLRKLCSPSLECAWTKEDLHALAQRLGIARPRRPKTGFMVPHDVWSADTGPGKSDPMRFVSAGSRAWNKRVLEQWFPDWVLS